MENFLNWLLLINPYVTGFVGCFVVFQEKIFFNSNGAALGLTPFCKILHFFKNKVFFSDPKFETTRGIVHESKKFKLFFEDAGPGGQVV